MASIAAIALRPALMQNNEVKGVVNCFYRSASASMLIDVGL